MTSTLPRTRRPWRYGLLRDRLVRAPTGALRFVERVKRPLGARGRIRALRRLRVDRYRIQVDGLASDVAIKYAPLSNARIAREVDAVQGLVRSGALAHPGLIVPEPIHIRAAGGWGRGLVTPWKPGGTLADRLRERSLAPQQLACIIGDCARALKALHSASHPTSDDHAVASVEHLRQANPGDPIARRLAAPVLQSLPGHPATSPATGGCWIHGDCFPHQFLLDDRETPRPWLCDWESATVARCGTFDVAQLWTSLELALVLDRSPATSMDTLWEALQEGYGRCLSSDVLFRILHVQALIRFSPRTHKFAEVVPSPWAHQWKPGPPHGSDTYRRAVESFDALFRHHLAALADLRPLHTTAS